MATAFPACSTRAAKPYGRHRPPNTPTSGLTKNCIKSVKGNNIPSPMNARVKGKFIVNHFCFIVIVIFLGHFCSRGKGA